MPEIRVVEYVDAEGASRFANRIYFGKAGESLVILLGGSTRNRQQQAIQISWRAWAEYKQRKAGQR